MARILVLFEKAIFEESEQSFALRSLLRALKECGHEADIIEIPKYVGPQNGAEASTLWRSLELASFGGAPVDLIITTCARSATVTHPNKLSIVPTSSWHLDAEVARVEQALNGATQRG